MLAGSCQELAGNFELCKNLIAEIVHNLRGNEQCDFKEKQTRYVLFWKIKNLISNLDQSSSWNLNLIVNTGINRYFCQSAWSLMMWGVHFSGWMFNTQRYVGEVTAKLPEPSGTNKLSNEEYLYVNY